MRLFAKHFEVLTNDLHTSEVPPLKEYLLVSPKAQITKLKVLKHMPIVSYDIITSLNFQQNLSIKMLIYEQSSFLK
jgi:hypothetical protein